MLIDSGASTNVIDEEAFRHISKAHPVVLAPSPTRILAYGFNTPLPVIGTFSATFQTSTTSTVAPVQVLKGNHGCLLSFQTASVLGLLTISVHHLPSQRPSLEHIAQDRPWLFHGIGQLKEFTLKLHINPTVVPIAQPALRLPFHLHKQVNQDLHQLEHAGIIEDVKGPTPWISPLIVVPRRNGGTVRLCVDMRRANAAIERECHSNPTVDDIIHALNGATCFSTLDLKAGYHQILVNEESRYITACSTPQGVKQYRRLNFGTKSASEMFQHVIAQCLRDIPGVLNISDDILIYGKTIAEHDHSLHAVFNRLESLGLTLNKDKCLLYQDKITFFGMVFLCDGVSPDPAKVAAIQNAPSPTSGKDVRTFLGMVTYCAKFIPHFSSMCEPLRNLTKKKAQFHWNLELERTFQCIKDALTSDTIMAYFDHDKFTELVTDASPFGLSAIFSQVNTSTSQRNSIAYVSRALSPVEQRYSQTEREALGIVWAIERLHIYLYGAKFCLYTDCKPIQLILGNRNSKPPTRIARWNLRIQDYDFDVIHKKGIDNPSDFLSRHPLPHDPSVASERAEQFVNFFTQHAIPKAMTLDDISSASKADVTICAIIDLVTNNNWHTIAQPAFAAHHPNVDMHELQLFSHIRQDLTVNTEYGIVLRDSRIVMPTTLHLRAIRLAHEGHQGLIKTKQLLREKVWFPLIDQLVQDFIDKCLACQATGPPTNCPPLEISDLPPCPWDTVHIDFCVPFPTGELLLVVIDTYSRFPEVDILTSTSASATIPRLHHIFATHGIPRVIRSDNGPPFHSADFTTFLQEHGITHIPITPLWPRANGQVENFMKPIKKAIQAACCDQLNWKHELYSFLLNYHSTPHCTTKASPAELLFNRKITTKLPQVPVEALHLTFTPIFLRSMLMLNSK